MKDNDKALVRSVVVRAVTAKHAENLVTSAPDNKDKWVFIIRAARFYKKLVHRNDVYKAVEDLFTANKAVSIMNWIENYRTPHNAFWHSPELVKEQAVKFMREATVVKSCPKCGLGIDSDGDGNCVICSSLAYQVANLATSVPETPAIVQPEISKIDLDAAAPLLQPAPNSPVEEITFPSVILSPEETNITTKRGLVPFWAQVLIGTAVCILLLIAITFLLK